MVIYRLPDLENRISGEAYDCGIAYENLPSFSIYWPNEELFFVLKLLSRLNSN